MRAKGKLTSWKDEKGYGFITPCSGGKPVFVHIKAFSNRSRRPVINQWVTYSLSTDGRGRSCAITAALADDRFHRSIKPETDSLSFVAAAVFLTIVGVAVVTAKVPAAIFALYWIASFLAFVLYMADKSAARKGARRIQEQTLHLLSLAGGWPGALVAQTVFRHKTRKQAFRTVFRVTVFLNCAAFIWLLSPTGAAMLRTLTGSGL